MGFNRFVSLLIAICAVVLTTGAQAALISRLGGLAVYDTVSNLSWLSDANAGAGSAFDDGFRNNDGLMTWANANAWAASLNIAGVTGWRLPTTKQPDLTCSVTTGGGTISQGFGCSGSEMGDLYYRVFGGGEFPFNPPLDGILSTGDEDLAFFVNIQSRVGAGGIYHSATSRNAANAWRFSFNNGGQAANNKVFGHYAWAVRDGDVGGNGADPIPVPAPAALVLLACALPFMRRGP